MVVSINPASWVHGEGKICSRKHLFTTQFLRQYATLASPGVILRYGDSNITKQWAT